MAIGNSAVFLDRDGVLTIPIFRNGRSYAAQTMQDYALYEWAPDAIAALREAGFLTVVVTNQPDVGAGKIPTETLTAMHTELTSQTGIDLIVACTHTKADDCSCRKPRDGMLRSSAKAHNIDLSASFMVGDRKSDVDAGIAAGCRTVFLDLGYTSEEKPTNMDYTCANVSQAVQWIIEQKHGASVTTEENRAITANS